MTRNTSARIAGSLYLALAVSGGFSELYVRAGVVVPGNPTATATNVGEQATMMRIGLAADLLNITLFVVVALLLYRLLESVNRNVALAGVALNAVGAAVMSVNMLNHLGALLVATRPAYTAGWGAGTADGLVALLLDMHGHGYLIAQIFFGLWLLPLGYLVYQSGFLPRALGVLLMIGGGGYVADVAASLAAPGFESTLSPYLTMPAGVAEVVFLLWLLLRGVAARPRTQPRAVPG